MELTDIAWAAGFYEGEGHLAYGGSIATPKVQISQCNKEPLDKLQNIFGGTVNGPYKVKGGNQPVYRWHITTHEDARHFIYLIFPYLSDKLQKSTLDKIDRYADVVDIRKAFCRKWHPRVSTGRCNQCRQEARRGK